MTVPRGIRNNNPGNVRYTGTKWKGLADPPSDGSFCRFETPEYGIRCIYVIISNYYTIHNIDTIRSVINRWAPPNENDTKAYIDHVSSKCGVGADQVIDPRSLNIMLPLIEAIILHENGEQPYHRSTILAGVKLN